MDWVENGFRKIKGCADLPALRLALTRPTPAADSVPGSPLRDVPTSSGTPSIRKAAHSTLTVVVRSKQDSVRSN